MKRFASIRAALVSGLIVSTAALPARAQHSRLRARTGASPIVPSGPPPVRFEVHANGNSFRWSYSIENMTLQPVEVVIDRHLLWLEIEPAPSAAPAPARRGASAAHRCLAPWFPSSNEHGERLRLSGGARYVEGFDVRELCGLRLPAALVPGVTIRAHYGYRTAHDFAHAIVLDGSSPPVDDLVADPFPLAGNPSAWPPAGRESDRGDPRLEVSVRGNLDGGSMASMSPTVRITSVRPYPLWTYFRPGQTRFELVGPGGEVIECRSGFRDYNPVRDFFVRLTRGRSLTETIQLANVCPADQITQAGVYRGQAVFETRASGQEFGLQSYMGASGSPYFYLRVTRPARPGSYRPLPTQDPFAPPPPNPDDDNPTQP